MFPTRSFCLMLWPWVSCQVKQTLLLGRWSQKKRKEVAICLKMNFFLNGNWSEMYGCSKCIGNFLREGLERLSGWEGDGVPQRLLSVNVAPLLEDPSSCLHSQDLMCVVRLLGSSSVFSRDRKPAGNANVYLTGGLINHQSPPSPFSPTLQENYFCF